MSTMQHIFPLGNDQDHQFFGFSNFWTAFFVAILGTSVTAFLVTACVLLQFQRRTFYLLSQMTQICASVARIISEVTGLIVELRQANFDLGQILLHMDTRHDMASLLAQTGVASGDDPEGETDVSNNAQGDN